MGACSPSGTPGATFLVSKWTFFGGCQLWLEWPGEPYNCPLSHLRQVRTELQSAGIDREPVRGEVHSADTAQPLSTLLIGQRQGPRPFWFFAGILNFTSLSGVAS